MMLGFTFMSGKKDPWKSRNQTKDMFSILSRKWTIRDFLLGYLLTWYLECLKFSLRIILFCLFILFSGVFQIVLESALSSVLNYLTIFILFITRDQFLVCVDFLLKFSTANILAHLPPTAQLVFELTECKLILK